MTKSERSYLSCAKAISDMSDHKFQIGAVLVKGHKIISSGCNSSDRTDPIQAKLDSEKYGVECPGRIHAETDCLLPFIKKRKNLNGAVLYVYREHKDGTLAMSRPCSSCMQLIRQCGIRDIVYYVEGGIAREKLEFMNRL